MTNEEEVAWCEGVWNMLRHGGVWAVPRSGLLFQKQSTRNALVLTERIPHHPEMPCTPEELREQQDEEVVELRKRFVQVGIDVLDETKGEHDVHAD